MPVQMIELEEVMMVEASDEALEAAVKVGPGTAVTGIPGDYYCGY